MARRTIDATNDNSNGNVSLRPQPATEKIVVSVEIEGVVYNGRLTAYLGGDTKNHYCLTIKDHELRGTLMKADRKFRQRQLLDHYGYERWGDVPTVLASQFEQEFCLLGTFIEQADENGEPLPMKKYRPTLPIGYRMVVPTSAGDAYVERDGTFSGVVRLTFVDVPALSDEVLAQVA